jgi:hypothetical protein
LLANRHLIFILFLLFCTLSCSTKHSAMLPGATQQIVNQAEQNGFVLCRYPTSTFTLTSYQRNTAPSPICHIYIEGDGNSWKTKHRLSNNPTPKQPLALQLALRDQHPQVIYVARPCQFTPLALDPSCDPKYWSSHRYAKEVIQAFQDILDRIKENHPPSQDGLRRDLKFVLIGFSGGASIAALIASERSDVEGLITVAGDLNHVALNQHHRTTPLKGSLNPMEVASKLQHLPQQHWSGSKDTVVPTWISNQFVQKVNNPGCCQAKILSGAEHHAGWVEKWSEIIEIPLECRDLAIASR